MLALGDCTKISKRSYFSLSMVLKWQMANSEKKRMQTISFVSIMLLNIGIPG